MGDPVVLFNCLNERCKDKPRLFLQVDGHEATRARCRRRSPNQILQKAHRLPKASPCFEMFRTQLDKTLSNLLHGSPALTGGLDREISKGPFQITICEIVQSSSPELAQVNKSETRFCCCPESDWPSNGAASAAVSTRLGHKLAAIQHLCGNAGGTQSTAILLTQPQSIITMLNMLHEHKAFEEMRGLLYLQFKISLRLSVRA